MASAICPYKSPYCGRSGIRTHTNIAVQGILSPPRTANFATRPSCGEGRTRTCTSYDYWRFSKPLPYQLGLPLHIWFLLSSFQERYLSKGWLVYNEEPPAIYPWDQWWKAYTTPFHVDPRGVEPQPPDFQSGEHTTYTKGPIMGGGAIAHPIPRTLSIVY